MEKISIIIPSINRKSYIDDILYDLGRQTLPADEIILIDQSTEPYQGSNLNSLIVIHDSSGIGPCRARNIALEKSSGDILIFLDDDIRIDNDFIEILCGPILSVETSVVVGAMCDQDGSYPNPHYPYWKKEYRNWIWALTANLDFPGKQPTMSFTTCCAAIHRSVYECIGGFDTYFDPDGAGEDREYGLRIFHAGYSILFNGAAKVKHIGAPTGGRRDVSPTNKYYGFSPLEANTFYIVAKYFGWNVYKNYVRSARLSLLADLATVNPFAIARTIKKIKALNRLAMNISKIKCSFE